MIYRKCLSDFPLRNLFINERNIWLLIHGYWYDYHALPEPPAIVCMNVFPDLSKSLCGDIYDTKVWLYMASYILTRCNFHRPIRRWLVDSILLSPYEPGPTLFPLFSLSHFSFNFCISQETVLQHLPSRHCWLSNGICSSKTIPIHFSNTPL